MSAISEAKMISFSPADLPSREGYRLFASLIIPRPIAWVSSIGTDGTLNLAPFSFLMQWPAHPPP